MYGVALILYMIASQRGAVSFLRFGLDWIATTRCGWFRTLVFRYENGDLREMDDCGELHDDMCAYFELSGNAAFAAGKQVRARKSPLLQEEVRVALFKDESSPIGRRVSVVRDKVVREGQVSLKKRSQEPCAEGSVLP